MQKKYYDDKIVHQFLSATMLWAGVAFLLGIVIATQLADWRFNFGLSWLTFGRLRPLHTNAAIFAFAGNAIFAGIYYSTQRLCKTRLFSDLLSQLHFWGWQLIIVAAAITLPLGISQSKEYAELEWPIDIAITVVWVIFAVNFFGTLIRRKERHMYVAIWFYIATIVTVAVLHIVNSLEVPVSWFQSYPIYAGAQDALVQWWYGHNAVAFFLTTPFLGLMYYFLPKAADRPVYSYRLSIIHFWALVFIYIWAGPHHLLYTALPEWAQSVGMVFSLMLWAPSWGGMINGLLTLRGAWDKVRQDPILKFMVAAVTFYGMSTFEGPLLSIKSVSELAHYTDWIVGHVHGGALGWNGFMTFGMIYFLVPKLLRTNLYSVKMATLHFWLGFVGIALYMISMWVSGISQGLMLNAVTEDGQLAYPDFVETVMTILPLYWVRMIGGLMYFAGWILMIVNVMKTYRASQGVQEEELPQMSLPDVKDQKEGKGHRWLEGLPITFTVLTTLAILVGSVIEIWPTFTGQSYVDANDETLPYTALEVAGRDVYVREGCYNCHSQMIRPIVAESLRYGPPSTIAESLYDRPFQWGSKRTGPDLARVGGKYPDLWHLRHMLDPRAVTPNSLMPKYPWLVKKKVDFSGLPRRLQVMKNLGVPYSQEEIDRAAEQAQADARVIAENLQKEGVSLKLEKSEMVALIAYLQRLGHNTKKKEGGQ